MALGQNGMASNSVKTSAFQKPLAKIKLEMKEQKQETSTATEQFNKNLAKHLRTTDSKHKSSLSEGK